MLGTGKSPSFASPHVPPMNARTFQRNVVAVIVIYALALCALVALRKYTLIVLPQSYETAKDAIPLVIAIPAAWLGYCLQRRQAYLKDVRELWSKLVAAFQEALQYTHLSTPAQPDFAKVMKTLSSVTEELRAVFSNVGEAEHDIGLFPFERLKEIQACVSALSFGGAFNVQRAASARREIVGKWKSLREHYLSELERGVPARPNSPYLR